MSSSVISWERALRCSPQRYCGAVTHPDTGGDPADVAPIWSDASIKTTLSDNPDVPLGAVRFQRHVADVRRVVRETTRRSAGYQNKDPGSQIVEQSKL
jgi:hypothetical protein